MQDATITSAPQLVCSRVIACSCAGLARTQRTLDRQPGSGQILARPTMATIAQCFLSLLQVAVELACLVARERHRRSEGELLAWLAIELN